MRGDTLTASNLTLIGAGSSSTISTVPGPSSRRGDDDTAVSFTYEVGDGIAAPVDTSATLDLTPVNDAPAGSAAGGSIAYVENQSPAVIDTALTVTDPDDTDFIGATVSITGDFVAGQDVLGFTDQNGITGSYNAATGVLTLSGTSLVANYQTALRAVTYFNSSDNPSTVARTRSTSRSTTVRPRLDLGNAGVTVMPVNDRAGDHVERRRRDGCDFDRREYQVGHHRDGGRSGRSAADLHHHGGRGPSSLHDRRDDGRARLRQGAELRGAGRCRSQQQLLRARARLGRLLDDQSIIVTVTDAAHEPSEVRNDFDGDGKATSSGRMPTARPRSGRWTARASCRAPMSGRSIRGRRGMSSARATSTPTARPTFSGSTTTAPSPNGSWTAPRWLRVRASDSIRDRPGTRRAPRDFNADGKADILWQNDNGAAAVWLMDGTTIVTGTNVGINPGPSWQVKTAARLQWRRQGRHPLAERQRRGRGLADGRHHPDRRIECRPVQSRAVMACHRRGGLQRRLQGRHPLAERQWPGRASGRWTD